ncbi:MAG: mechanosensitive ion channel domain-containing protein [Bacteroidota bacterium]
MNNLLTITLTGVISFSVTVVLFQLVKYFLKKLGQYEAYKELFILIWPLSILIAIIFSYLTADFKGEVDEVWNQPFQITVIIISTWLIISLIGSGKIFIIRKYDLDQEDNLNARKVHTQIRLFSRIINVIIIIVSFSLVLMTFKSIREIGASILASAGILSIIIGVAAQKLIANILAGFQIALTQPIRIGDAVVIEGEWGWIEEITLTYVVVRVWDKRRLIIPTTQIIEKPFQNWTRNNAEILGTVFIYADYTLSVEELRKEFNKILEATSLWDGKVKVVQVSNATEKTMEIRALMSAKNSPTAWDLRVHVREKLIEFLQKNYPRSLPKQRVVIDRDEVS